MNVASANIFVGTLYDRSENLMVANQLRNVTQIFWCAIIVKFGMTVLGHIAFFFSIKIVIKAKRVTFICEGKCTYCEENAWLYFVPCRIFGKKIVKKCKIFM